MSIIDVQDLSKRFGSSYGVKGVSFSVERGECVGLLGPNGAGKTTLMRMMLNLARASSGQVRLFDELMPQHAGSILRRVGATVESPALYGHMTGRANLLLWARPLAAAEQVDSLLERVRLGERGHERVNTYSLGMKARLSLARCLLSDPQLLILDEPTNGLDPVGMREVRDLLSELTAEGRTVFVSSHLLDEVARTCKRIIIINHGSILYDGAIRNLSKPQGLLIHSSEPEKLRRVLTGHKSVIAMQDASGGVTVTLRSTDDHTIENLVTFVTSASVPLSRVIHHQEDLEDAYLRITGGNSGDTAIKPRLSTKEGSS